MLTAMSTSHDQLNASHLILVNLLLLDISARGINESRVINMPDTVTSVTETFDASSLF